jgi:hypothetical protein
VQDVGLDDAVQELAADEAELAIDGGRSAAHVVPALGAVVRDRRVGVLEVRDGDCVQGLAEPLSRGLGERGGTGGTYRASGSPTGTGGSTTRACW